jgi:4-hydroxybenzoate polyprenyltransferase
VPAELQILADVATYRLRRLEMANLAGATALALTLHLGSGETALRLVFGLLLNLLVYLNNDFHDRDDDLLASAREQSKTAFLVAHRGAAIRAQVGLAALLAVIAGVADRGLWIPLVFGGGVCWAYSAVLKHRPVVDVAAMMIWGVTMSMVGVPPEHLPTAMPLLVMLGLFSGVFESVQVLRDHDTDRARGVRTTAVLLGPARCTMLARSIAVLAGLYVLVAFGALVALPTFVVVILPMRGRDPVRVWQRIRVLCGLTFVAACVTVWRSGP